MRGRLDRLDGWRDEQLELLARCGSGFWGGQRLSLADYLMVAGATMGATAAGGG